jgi:hypothetical protein
VVFSLKKKLNQYFGVSGGETLYLSAVYSGENSAGTKLVLLQLHKDCATVKSILYRQPSQPNHAAIKKAGCRRHKPGDRV